MIDQTQYVYYLTYALVAAVVGICFLKMKSMEPLTITTKEFKSFQSSFMIGYMIMILGELIAIGSFYQTLTLLDLKLEQITKLYIVTIVSTTACSVLSDVIDFGPRRNKCIISAFLLFMSMLCIYSGGHYELLMLSRVSYGAASSLLHSEFDAYLVQEHSSLGFPEDWLNQTFTMLTHGMALISCLSGILGQSSSSLGGVFGPTSLCCLLFIAVTFYISFSWKKDLNGAKFMLSSFTSSWSQGVRAVRSNKQLTGLLLICTFSEASITIFTFYWAPWLNSVVIEKTPLEKFPYCLIFSSYVAASMLGAYLHQLFVSKVGNENICGFVLIGSSVAYFLGAVFQTPVLVFGVSLLVHLFMGMYWPSIGHARGRVVTPELRSATLCMTR